MGTSDVNGLLVMAYGTPPTTDPADVEAYYTHIRRGRPPTPELLADLRRRYDAIGGSSPLLDITRRQAARLADALGDEWRVELGMKHAPPFLEDGVAALAVVDAVVGLVLAPHYSRLSVGEYVGRVQAAAPDRVRLEFVESWHLLSAYVEFLAGQLRSLDGGTHVVFTAHSLPARILGEGDPYPVQLRETAEAVAEAAGVENWSVAWQSAGRTEEEWLGPTILDVIAKLAADGVAGVVVCPAGFVSDHLEILFDLDVEARRVAEDAGVAFSRTQLLNDDPGVLAALADVVRSRA